MKENEMTALHLSQETIDFREMENTSDNVFNAEQFVIALKVQAKFIKKYYDILENNTLPSYLTGMWSSIFNLPYEPSNPNWQLFSDITIRAMVME